jgi:hypothetical protein
MTETASTRRTPPAVVANVGAVYRLLMTQADTLPESFAVNVWPDEVSVQLFTGTDDLAAVEAVWALAGLLDQRGEPRAVVTDTGACHLRVGGRLGDLPVSVVTVLTRPSAPAASAATEAA